MPSNQKNQCLEFLENLKPEPMKKLALQTRSVILETIPEIREVFKWSLPFYQLQRNLVYLNPKRDHLVVGFVDGAKMFDGQGKLRGRQDQVRHYLIHKESDLNETFQDYLLQAKDFAEFG